MKITSIPQIYRNLNRAVEIFSVLSKYGLADWIYRLDVEFAKDLLKNREGAALARHGFETRIRFALTELGTTFIKLGQVLSTRADLVGVALASELEQLQAHVPADPPVVIRATIQSELERPVDELFAEFDEEALASASIGQVHKARLKTGQVVVVKVQHQGIEERIRVDLDILHGLAQLAERVPEFKNYRPLATVDEFRRTLLRELDFTREMRHMERFARDFVNDATILIPKFYRHLSTERVLTMQYIDGVKLAEADRLRAAGFDLEQVARHGAQVFLEMIFTHGFYHADPHPGNIVLLPGNVIGLLDFGMVGQIDEPLREDIEEMLFAINNRVAAHLTAIITRVGVVPADADRAGLSVEVADFVSHYASVSVSEFDLTGAINEMTEIIRRYHIMLPARIALLLKVLVMLEGTARLISPRFSLTEVLQPYGRKALWRRMSPRRQLRKLRRLYGDLEQLAGVLPRGIIDIVEQIQSGKFDVHLEHRGLEPSVNRLVLGLLTSSLFVGSALMLCHKVPPLLPSWLGGHSALGIAGCGLAIVVGLRLLWAIRKSGRLEQKK
jgi:ubiquinone biosynthesis protein